MTSAALLAVLTLIGNILPLLTGGSTTVTLIENIIAALVKFMPLIVNEASTVYQSVKNIIDALSSNPATTADQMTALTALDKQVDDAWNAIESQIDPDAAPAPITGT
jgi:uncharacterized membrane protein